jgi:hypothetical protein
VVEYFQYYPGDIVVYHDFRYPFLVISVQFPAPDASFAYLEQYATLLTWKNAVNVDMLIGNWTLVARIE